MRTVAVTGGIGSGKSAVCSILSARGIPVYDSDSAAKRLYEEDDQLMDSIEEALGCGLRTAAGEVDYPKMASIIFSSKESLSKVEALVHPAVLRDFKRWRAMQEDRFSGSGRADIFFGNEPFCVIESAIILDKPAFLAAVDKVVMVEASLAVRVERACARDGAPKEKVIQRIAAQRFDLSKVDAFIRNEGTLEQLRAGTDKVFGSLDFRIRKF